ncbi:hypothetical protein [Streptomyces sp. NPDC017529]|uniref:hypothetical protein n=1 Tax=Streptomyces sp. NPDC017529 TaxID=3365000 RepID=UPI0037BA91E3
MKIRRALSAAAAAAVLAPAAVLASPAVSFAAGPVAETGSRTPASPGPSDSPAPAGRGADSAANDGAANDGGATSNGAAEASRRTPGTPPAAAGKSGADTGAGTASGKGTTSDDNEGQTCAFASDQLRVAVRGLPSRLAAGGAWSPFSMTLANTTGTSMDKVLPFLRVSPHDNVEWPYGQLETEYRDEKTDTWKTFRDAEPEDLFGFFEIGAHDTVTLRLRTRAVKDAKPGTGFALAAGDFRNRDGSCGSAKEAWSDFTILPRGAQPTQTPTAKPEEPGGSAGPGQSAAPGGGADGSGPGGGVKPQGGGHLAATGSSAALPAVALAGAAAVAVGAGTVFAVRRRKAVAGPGAAA